MKTWRQCKRCAAVSNGCGPSESDFIIFFAWSCLFFQEVVIVHEKEEKQFSDFDCGGSEKLLLISV